MHRDGETLSDWERGILREMEREMEAGDATFVSIFRRGLDPVRRLVLAAVVVAAGAVIALTTFAVSIPAGIAGLATMGAGIGAGVDAVAQMLRDRIARGS